MYQHARFVVRGILVTGGALCAACQSNGEVNGAVNGEANGVTNGVIDSQAQTAAASPSFVEFESGQVRPVAMSSDGTRLFAVNTPNGSLEIFNITDSGP